MKKVAITGNIACGKSLAFKYINEQGYPVIDCDDIVKDLYKKRDIIDKINALFPEVVEDNKISLSKIKDMLFFNSEKKLKFENLIYPHVIEEFNSFFEKNTNADSVFVIVPLLFEAGMEKYFDKIILIIADDNLRKMRLESRNSTLSNSFDEIMLMQLPQEEKIRKADYVIENNGSSNEFKEKLIKILK